jgi:hypothetical protein
MVSGFTLKRSDTAELLPKHYAALWGGSQSQKQDPSVEEQQEDDSDSSDDDLYQMLLSRKLLGAPSRHDSRTTVTSALTQSSSSLGESGCGWMDESLRTIDWSSPFSVEDRSVQRSSSALSTKSVSFGTTKVSEHGVCISADQTMSCPLQLDWDCENTYECPAISYGICSRNTSCDSSTTKPRRLSTQERRERLAAVNNLTNDEVRRWEVCSLLQQKAQLVEDGLQIIGENLQARDQLLEQAQQITETGLHIMMSMDEMKGCSRWDSGSSSAKDLSPRRCIRPTSESVQEDSFMTIEWTRSPATTLQADEAIAFSRTSLISLLPFIV